ncbi:hypothetical protein [Chitinophaga rhizosphaerae]|uniref:hypothetical protein n=1 Tax=Chitinophaga rhizosphaerae TaxID=1864947 RepID=UPI000F80FE48|nr:hypothetical protein [Chitinophaga rhizosphaerae]
MCEVGPITRQCGAATPGIAKLYLAEVGDITNIGLPGPTDPWTIETPITLTAGKFWKDIPFVELEAGLVDEIADAVNGGFKKDIPFKLARYNAANNKWVNDLIGARVIAIIADNNDQMIIVGSKKQPLRLEKAKGDTGQKPGDKNGWELNLTGNGDKPCFFYTGAVPLS